jgi:hypothetical protein
MLVIHAITVLALGVTAHFTEPEYTVRWRAYGMERDPAASFEEGIAFKQEHIRDITEKAKYKLTQIR